MTDTSSIAITYSTAPPPLVTTAPLASPLVNGSVSDANLHDEEDYTIKCICSYSDDDGNTVFCEKCETWQHIECYYPETNVPEFHFCGDCQPRPLDGKRATERQKRLREQSDGGDRKSKRPAHKNQKKKLKQSSTITEQANGWHKHERHDSASVGRDQPPPNKKPKTNHRPSGSINSVNGALNPTDSRKRAFSNAQSYPSPTKSPQDHSHTPFIPTYTIDFLELYERDEGKDNISADRDNFHTINATKKLSAWQQNPLLLMEETGRHDIDDPFIYSDRPLDRSTWPQVNLEYKVNPDVEIEGRHPSWHLLRLQSDVRKSQVVGEIKGRIGVFAEYCSDPSNRWQELRHPEPFVFFHPSMPIYIDSRREGTKFRYLRRSCHPNVTLKTYTTSDGQWHYCFVASQDLTAGTELTAQWYMDRFDQESKFDDMDWPYNWASRLLANFGDCACDKTEPCRLANLDRRRLPRSLEVNAKSQGRKKKSKTRQAVSPLSTGHATNSRAGSENVKAPDDDDQADSPSVSGSSRSKSQSRDLTPTHLGSLDADPVLGTGLTAREKRKIAMVEKVFERNEQGQHVQKKKKRTSGGSTLNTPSATTSHQLGYSNPSVPNTPGVTYRHSYTDAAMSNRFSGSPPPLKAINSRKLSEESQQKTSAPTTPSFLAPFPRPVYADLSVQTDPDEPEYADLPPSKRRKFCTPNQRLLKLVFEDRARFDMQQNEREPTKANHADALQEEQTQVGKVSEDVEMKDIQSSSTSPAHSPIVAKKALGSPSSVKSGPLSMMTPPLPSQAAHSYATFQSPNGQRLHLTTLPPTAPPSTVGAPTTPASVANTSGTTPSTAQSPFNFASGLSSYPGLSNNLGAPSPVKKKLSLGDYMSRRSNLATTPTVEKSQNQSLEPAATPTPPRDPGLKAGLNADDKGTTLMSMVKPSESFQAEAMAQGGADGSAIVDTPLKDQGSLDPMEQATTAPPTVSAATAASDSSTTALTLPSGLLPPEVANVLSTLNAMVPISGSRRSPSAS